MRYKWDQFENKNNNKRTVDISAAPTYCWMFGLIRPSEHHGNHIGCPVGPAEEVMNRAQSLEA